jgi:Arc/MetJ-type ribon-helix-helix transcriptional regulator
MRRNDLKIVTVNIPESYLESIKRLIGDNGLYPSRSELIRCAVREFLIKELRRATELIKYKEVEIEKLDDKNFVRVPIEKMDENNEPVREFKTYKIVKRLEY